MERRSVESIVKALNDGQVRYLIAGGLAVVAHGHLRLTADVDLMLDLDPENCRRAIAALSALGYRPPAPVPFAAFAEPERRAAWRREKDLTVFSICSPDHPATEVDLFVEDPIDFAAAYGRRVSLEVAPGVPASFVALEDLIEMKRRAGRAVDLEDVRRLESLRDLRRGDR